MFEVELRFIISQEAPTKFRLVANSFPLSVRVCFQFVATYIIQLLAASPRTAIDRSQSCLAPRGHLRMVLAEEYGDVHLWWTCADNLMEQNLLLVNLGFFMYIFVGRTLFNFLFHTPEAMFPDITRLLVEIWPDDWSIIYQISCFTKAKLLLHLLGCIKLFLCTFQSGVSLSFKNWLVLSSSIC